MGTRSLTLVKSSDLNSENLLGMSRQFDGYPSGHGQDLKDIFKNTRVINGIREHKAPDFANGMGCFGAQLIQNLKDEIGGIYVSSPNDKGEGCDYIYTFYITQNPSSDDPVPLSIVINDGEKDIYNGLLSECNMDSLE